MEVSLEENITILKSTTTKYGVIELRSDNILTYHPNRDRTQFTLKELKEIVIIFKEITAGKPTLYYCDISHMSDDTNSESKAYMKETLHLFASACAVHTKSSITIFFANIFLHLYKPKVQSKLFNDEESAIKWLKSIKN